MENQNKKTRTTKKVAPPKVVDVTPNIEYPPYAVCGVYKGTFDAYTERYNVQIAISNGKVKELPLLQITDTKTATGEMLLVVKSNKIGIFHLGDDLYCLIVK